VSPGTRLRSVALAVVLLVGLPVLTGCAAIEGIIEQQTGGDLDLGGDTVPDDFPSEVPLAAGTVINGSAITAPGGEKVWNVLMEVTDADAPASIAAQLEAAGFVAPGVGGVTDTGGTLTYARDDLVVNVVLAKVDSGWTANYTVARAAG
jgi:hypothetical protein